jgi:hypothetical protein
MPVSRLHRSGLTLVEDSLDERAVQRELELIDDRLFLSWEISHGRRLYRVLYDRGDEAPAPIAEWRGPNGEPLPLSSGLVELVKSLRPRGGVDLEASQKANEALRERQLRDFDYDVDEAAADVGPRISDKRSAVLHRGVHLRRARDKRRAEGKEF